MTQYNKIMCGVDGTEDRPATVSVIELICCTRGLYVNQPSVCQLVDSAAATEVAGEPTTPRGADGEKKGTVRRGLAVRVRLVVRKICAK